ncbi:hypothetical protein GTR04_7358 [Trichophyton interdigitale]|uniref:Uncharacterized protein n=1 Tax=Trichophyton interdigitale (strain MR816) TaxID=1215338 RepID=A0A059J7U0_TRIIM|nr:hypothetical protein H101_06554 [Trichophyton interdigitale H6]KAG5203915.1 hypothetical protein GY631_7357 [Trichophyton interdigitale]KAG5216723.1 hypothetical protein GY632_7273 [Trichophyton interdigitale]KAG8205256.1 hypothetical protein GTR04_7358 [Trichophyton interdigitale]KDB23864.1 hypothetical protein H109_04258 [Trichophyton interdigitale MR816]
MLFLNALLALSSALTVFSAPGDRLGVIRYDCNEGGQDFYDSECQPYDEHTSINATVPIKCNFYSTVNCTAVDVPEESCVTVDQVLQVSGMYFQCVSAED